MRKALIFCLSYYPHLVGGAEVAVKEITDRLGEDFEFDMVTLYAGKSRFERIGNVNVYRVGPHIKVIGASIPHISYPVKFCYVAVAFFKALLLQRKRQYDFIWSIMASFNGFSALFFKIIHRKIPFLLTLQEGDTAEHVKKMTSIMYPLYVQIFKKADCIQAISTYLDKYGKTMGATCKSIVIPNGVNFKFFSEPSPASQIKALQHELGLDAFDSVLITTSRLVPKNGVGDIIDALSYLPESVKLLILGIGPLEKMLKEKARLLGLEKRAIFVGFVPHRELPIYLHTAHIFVRPSLSEGQGVSFVEAMAAGLPVIATRVGGIPDFLTDTVTGLFCEVENGKSIALKAELLVHDEGMRNLIIKNARDIVREKYDWNLIASQIGKLFDEITFPGHLC
jgi:glycosyltransferase involved in cell wall biosynthesis